MSAEPMTEEAFTAIKARAKTAEPGPWVAVSKEDDRPLVCTKSGLGIARCQSWAHDHANAVFIAHARTDVPALVAEVERLREALAMSRSAHAVAIDSLRQTERNNLRAAVRLREILGADQVEQTADAARRVVAERDALRAVVDRTRELVAASRHTDDCAASHHQHCGAECDYDDSTPEECARAYREGCECGLRELCDALGVEVPRG